MYYLVENLFLVYDDPDELYTFVLAWSDHHGSEKSLFYAKNVQVNSRIYTKWCHHLHQT